LPTDNSIAHNLNPLLNAAPTPSIPDDVGLEVNDSLPPEMTATGGTEEVSKNVRRWFKSLQDEKFRGIIKVAIENGDTNQTLVERLFEGDYGKDKNANPYLSKLGNAIKIAYIITYG
jgi:hypothetical protein